MNTFTPNRLSVSTPAELGVQPASNAGKWLLSIFLFLFVWCAMGAWYGVNQYNGLQKQDERADAEWNNVLNQYARRSDLIPNLVTVVRSYAAYESALFKELADARAKLGALTLNAQNSRDPHAIERFLEAQDRLSAPLSRLLVVSEKYPELKASDLYRDLMAQLEGTENRVSYSRQRYIDTVADYNFALRRFPTNLIARQSGFKPRPQFTAANASVGVNAPTIDLK